MNAEEGRGVVALYEQQQARIRELEEQLEFVTRERDERLAVNVGLIAENTALKRKLAEHPLTKALKQELGEDSIPATESALEQPQAVPHSGRGLRIRLGLSDDALEELGIEVEPDPATSSEGLTERPTGASYRSLSGPSEDSSPASRSES